MREIRSDDNAVLAIQADGDTASKEINMDTAPSTINSSDVSSGKESEDTDIVLSSTSPSRSAECVESGILAGLIAHEAYDLADEKYHEAILAGFSTQEATNYARDQSLSKAALISTAKSSSSDVQLCEHFWISYAE